MVCDDVSRSGAALFMNIVFVYTDHFSQLEST